MGSFGAIGVWLTFGGPVEGWWEFCGYLNDCWQTLSFFLHDKVNTSIIEELTLQWINTMNRLECCKYFLQLLTNTLDYQDKATVDKSSPVSVSVPCVSWLNLDCQAKMAEETWTDKHAYAVGNFKTSQSRVGVHVRECAASLFQPSACSDQITASHTHFSFNVDVIWLVKQKSNVDRHHVVFP